MNEMVTKNSKNGRVALAVMRTQPLHLGHKNIADIMLKNFDTVIIGSGSSNQKISIDNPYPINIRLKMWKTLFGDKIKLVPLADLGSTENTNDWCDYVLSKIKNLGLPDPTDYFTGSVADAVWYKGRFFNDKLDIDSNPDDNFKINDIERKLHIIDREKNDIPSATELRQFLVTNHDEWKKWVPEEIHNLVDTEFPKNFRIGKKIV